MSDINKKNINYGALNRFYKNLKSHDLSGLATEQYVDDAIAEIPQLESGENVSIENGKINAIGYKADETTSANFVELPVMRVEPFMDSTSMLPNTDLYFTGDAGATEYTVSGQLIDMVGSMIGQVAFQVGSGNIATLTSYDSTNSKVTLDMTLDANNALSSAQMSKLYMIINTVISGNANTTTYSYNDYSGGGFHAIVLPGMKIKIGDYDLAIVSSITNNSITLDGTLDANNAVSNAPFVYALQENNKATGLCAHAEGSQTTASGMTSHAEGMGTLAQSIGEHAEGNYNVSHYSKNGNVEISSATTVSSIGVGSGVGMKKNALEVLKNGDMYLYGIGGYDGIHIKHETGYESVNTLQEYLASLEARIAALENPSA